MKKIIIVLVAGMLLALTVSCCRKSGHCGRGHCPVKAEGTTMEVVNIENGVTITLTASDAAVVKKIQEHAVKMKECRASGKCGTAKKGCPSKAK